MTYYKRSSETQRNDPELREAIKQELADLYKVLAEAKTLLQKAQLKLAEAKNIEEDELDQGSGLFEARVAVSAAIRRFEYKIDHKPTEIYIGNVAASMAPGKAEELKEKYRGETS